ncbi:MAG TPA: hypothetical protein VLF94_08965 [Chlamydiales bacterium]|nr:hypothetical protein [Chlamydiales bacterium]
MPLKITSTGESPVAAIAIGTVTDTLKGVIDPKLKKKRFRASDYSFGFAGGSPREITSIGESVLVGGVCYATSTDIESPDYGKVIHGPEFVTGGMFLLPKGALPTHLLTLSESMKFEDLISEIYHSVQRPVAFVGLWDSEILSTMAIGRAAIDGLPIFENRDYYFPKPLQTLQKVRCFIMGVATSFGDAQWKSLNKQLEAALYNNPLDRQGALTSHTHCVVVNKDVARIENVHPGVVQACYHVFADKTTLSNAHLNLYTLDRVVR